MNTNKTKIFRGRNLTTHINLTGYNGDLRILQKLIDRKYLQKKQRSIEKSISFLDRISFGENEINVRKILGEPLFIYRNRMLNLTHTVYSYGLRSGSNKIKAEIHFIGRAFFLGTVYYHLEYNDHNDINRYLKSSFGLDVFHSLHDIIVDPSENFIECHFDQNFFVMTFSKLKWNNSETLFRSIN